MNDKTTTAARVVRPTPKPIRPAVVDDDDRPARRRKARDFDFVAEAIPYVFQTVRNVTTVVVSVAILAVGFRLYVWYETGRQADALKAARDEAVARNLAKQAEIQKDLDRLNK